ncbi:MAG: hypothetical protein R3246_00655 [Acidimicrobiia bacterium]|nr:hypothetical protein [Acidimicrobiia bacterium]
MTPHSLPTAARALISSASGLVAVTVLLLMSMPFGIAGLTEPTPASILAGAAILTTVMPRIRDTMARVIERNPRWATGNSYELMAAGSRLPPETRPDALLSDLAELARSSVAASSAKVQSELGEAVSGSPSSATFRTAVNHRGREIASITVTNPSPLNAQQRTKVEQLASSVGVVVANAVAVGRVEERIAELDRTIELITLRRRSVVEAETGERKRVAADVVAGAEPMFRQLESQIGVGDFDAAADTCDQLIVFLRGFSTAMRKR